METIGIIGVGYIGKTFVDAVREAGHPVVAFDVDDTQLEYVTERDGEAVDSPRAVAKRSDVLLIALPGTPEVEATFEEIGDALSGVGLVVDSTTTLPETSIACEEICREYGAAFVEAPLTRAAPRPGLHVFVGGTVDAYEAAKPILETLCDVHFRVGEAGEATVFKLGVQLRYAGHNAIDAEVVAFLQDNDVDPEPLAETLEMDLSEQFFTGEFEQAIEGLGGLRIWNKDVGYALDVSRERNTALPLAASVHEAYKTTTRHAGDDPDRGHAATILEYWQRLNDRTT